MLIEFNVHQRCWNKGTPPPLLHCLSERGGQRASFLDNVYNKNTFSQILQLDLKPFTWRRDFLTASTDFSLWSKRASCTYEKWLSLSLSLKTFAKFGLLILLYFWVPSQQTLIKYNIQYPCFVNERLVFK